MAMVASRPAIVVWAADAPKLVRITFKRDGDGMFGEFELIDGTTHNPYRARSKTNCNEIAQNLAAAVSIAIGRPVVPHDPVANDDSYEVDEDISRTLAVLINDWRADAVATAVLDSDATHGTLHPVEGGFVYIPDNNYSGPDSFTYRVRGNGKESPPATVKITVTPVHDRPIANDDHFDYPNEGRAVVRRGWDGVLRNDHRGDSLSLRAELVDGVKAGTLSLRSDGGFSYEASATSSTSETFTYRVHDEMSVSDVATVTLLRLVPPEATPTPTSPPGPLAPITLYASSEGGFSYWSGGRRGPDDVYQSTVTTGDVVVGGGTELGRGYFFDVAVAGYAATKRDRRIYTKFEQLGRGGSPNDDVAKEELAATAMRAAVRFDSSETSVALGVLVGGYQATGCRHDRTGARRWSSPLCTETEQWAAFPTFSVRLGPDTGPYATLGFLDGRSIAGNLAHLGAGMPLKNGYHAQLTMVAATEGVGPRMEVEVPMGRRVVLIPSIAGGMLYESFLLRSNGRNSSWLRAGIAIGMRQPDGKPQENAH